VVVEILVIKYGNEMIYQNYHRHDNYSNVITPDSTVLPEHYAQRAVELGHGIISSVNHGWAGRYIEHYELAKKYDLKFLFGTEAYMVNDRLEKDRTNAHIVLLAKNENGRRSINRILSEANITGFYYKPRIDLSLLFSLPKDDVWVSSACIAGVWKYENYEEIILKIAKHFRKNFFLEVQNHNTPGQKFINKRIISISNQNSIPIIFGCDSHYIFPNQASDRDDYLLSKHIEYEDEDGWYMDYPDGEEAIERFKIQGVLSNAQIKEAMNNTNILLDVEEYNSAVFSKGIKLPTIHKGKTQEEKDTILKDLIEEKWQEEKQNVPEQFWDKYENEIYKELTVVIETGMADYFLLDYEVVKRGKELGGFITLTGRGCFTKDALVHTLNGMKTIDKIEVNDQVIGSDGKFHSVYKTMQYETNEEMISIEHLYGGKKYHPYVCTKNHKILVRRNDKNVWVEAKDICKKDYVCLPKINFDSTLCNTIDLNEYNTSFDFDEKYIYEIKGSGIAYPHSPGTMAKKYGVATSLFKNFAKGNKNCFKRKKEILTRFFADNPFSTQQEYVDYTKDQRTRKINRHIKIDEHFNLFVGMMYGDGFTAGNSRLGLAIHTENHKNIINRKIFEKMAKRLGVGISERKSETKNLSQLYFSSSCFRSFFDQEMFVSKKGKIKKFNAKFFSQSKENLKAIAEGLMISDGCRSKINFYDRNSFDNTSSSLINAFKIMGLATGNYPMSLCIRKAYADKRGYNCKTSYKLRINDRSKILRKTNLRCLEDDKFWYLPVREKTVLSAKKRMVYDFSVLGTHDYLLNNMIVHNSSAGFYLSKLLGFTTVDRISATVKLFPERFITKERILEAGNLPDIDFNLGNPEIFAQAQIDVLGENRSYPMIAFGTLRPKAAWKMFARAKGIGFDIANRISEQIGDYDKALYHAGEDEKEDIVIFNYVDEDYHDLVVESEKYLGIVSQAGQHPCAYLLFDGNISEEIGLMKIKDNLCCIMDGLWAEKYGFLKNDLLKVSVVEGIYKTFQRIGIDPHPLPELIELCKDNPEVWAVYKNAWTMGINQFEQRNTSGRAAKYAPQNISELSAFVAAVRPGFKSNYKQFEAREPFSYGVPSLDSLIQTEEFPQSYLLYQENAMQVMEYSGVPTSETYDVIKYISKKRIEKVLKYKKEFFVGMTRNIIQSENKLEEEAKKTSKMIWQIIEDSSHYLFNAAHSYCTAGDSLYGAYLKSHYPLHFYETFLRILEKGGDKNRLAETKKEAQEAFQIKFPQLKFGQDNREMVANTKTKEITSSLGSIKGFRSAMGEELFNLSQNEFEDFIDLLVMAEENSVISKKFEDLIKINYFDMFGNNKKLLKIFEEFVSGKSRYSKKHKQGTKNKRILELKFIFGKTPNEKFPILSQLDFDNDVLGYVQSSFENIDKRLVYVLSIQTKFSPRVQAYCLSNGSQVSLKIQKSLYDNNLFLGGDILYIKRFKKKPTVRFEDGKFIQNEDGSFDWWIDQYNIIEPEKFDEIVKEVVDVS